MTTKTTWILCVVLSTLTAVSCCVARGGQAINSVKDTIATNRQLDNRGVTPLLSQIEECKSGYVVIKHHYDLQGKEIIFKEGSTLVFKGGSLSNGSIKGNNTKIVYKRGAVFDNVSVSGTWVVTNISTDMFRDLNYVNSLADVLAFTNPAVYNHVIIKDYGYEYPVRVSSVGVYEAPLRINSNTDLQLDGTISLLGNNLFQYRIMLLNNCQNVKIKGNGGIKGDRESHDYSIDEEHKAWKSHEWGHGIKLSNCQNIEISGIFVNDCTGDSFSIGENSEKITLYKITAEGSRRQGVTISVASDVTVDKCIFQNIGKNNGTAPGAAVDVEPDNSECEIKNIRIKDCIIHNCRNGIVSYSKGYGTTWTESVAGKSVVKTDGRHYVNITIKGCSISGTHDAFSLIGWDKGEIEDCKVSEVELLLRAPQNILVKGNEIECKYFIPHNICVENCEITNNKLLLKTKTDLMLKKSAWNNNKVTSQSQINVRVEE